MVFSEKVLALWALPQTLIDEISKNETLKKTSILWNLTNALNEAMPTKQALFQKDPN